jgi:hypothetical protein
MSGSESIQDSEPKRPDLQDQIRIGAIPGWSHGGMLKTEKPQTRVAHDIPAFFADLERGGALSSFQVQRLLAAWPLTDDWATDPYFGTVREHTRAYIDRLASLAVGGA